MDRPCHLGVFLIRLGQDLINLVSVFAVLVFRDAKLGEESDAVKGVVVLNNPLLTGCWAIIRRVQTIGAVEHGAEC